MIGVKTQKLVLDSNGAYLGMEKGCFTVKDKNGEVKRFSKPITNRKKCEQTPMINGILRVS